MERWQEFQPLRSRVNTAGAVRNEFNDNARNTDSAPWFKDIPAGLPGFFYESDYYWARFNGLTALSDGAISILNTNVNWNQNDFGGGIVAINENAFTAKTVTISNAETQGNFSHGIMGYIKRRHHPHQY